MPTGPTRPIQTECDHNIMSDICSLDVILKPQSNQKDGKPDYVCHVCKQEFYNEDNPKK